MKYDALNSNWSGVREAYGTCLIMKLKPAEPPTRAAIKLRICLDSLATLCEKRQESLTMDEKYSALIRVYLYRLQRVYVLDFLIR
jgi:hypothetical protein